MTSIILPYKYQQFAGRERSSLCKCPEAKISLACLRERQKTQVAGATWAVGQRQNVADEVVRARSDGVL